MRALLRELLMGSGKAMPDDRFMPLISAASESSDGPIKKGAIAMVATIARADAHVPAAAGEVIHIFDEEMVVKVTGEGTDGAYAVIVGSVAPGGGPPLHAHPGSETCYILSGAFAFTLRDQDGVSTFRAGPGDVVNAPGGVLHRFENISPTRSTMLIIGAADTVDFLRELGAAFPPGVQPDMEKMLAINTKYRVETAYGEEGSRSEPPKDGATSARARALAWRFQHANEQLIAAIADCRPAQWRAVCADTGWTVGVQAHHIAVNQVVFAHIVQDAVAGCPHPPMPSAKLDEINAQHAAEFAHVTVAATVALLQANGAVATQTFARLTDEQLDLMITLAEGYTISVAGLIEHHAIDEIERHGGYLRNAMQASGA